MKMRFIISILLLQFFATEALLAQKSPTSSYAPNPEAEKPATKPKPAKETTEAEDIVNEFKETKFLQVDRLDVPKELKIIEDQIRENAIDVVINSKTHTPVFAQKKSDGYSDDYKKFHGLEIQIQPIPNESDFYSLKFFYYNWTNNKVDKRLNVKISKYNVLNELRFGLYELLLGKQFVIDNKEQIEKENFDRIQAVRKGVDERKKEERKKQKEKKKLDEELEARRALQEQQKIKREELDKKKQQEDKKKSDSLESEQSNSNDLDGNSGLGASKNVDEKNNKELSNHNANDKSKRGANKEKNTGENSSSLNEKNTNNLEPIPPADSIPTTSDFYVFGSIFEDQTNSIGLITTTTYLRYLGFGARYVQEQLTDSPRGMRFAIKAGMAIKKDDYDVPVFRSFETEIYKGKIFTYFKAFAGLDYSPVNFVNLPIAGEGLKFFENDIFWAKVGGSFSPIIFEKNLELRTAFLKSLMASSNQKKSFSGTSLIVSAYYQQNERYGLEMGYLQTYLIGDLEVDSKSISMAFVYKLEN